MISVLPYHLPDVEIINSEKDFIFLFWQPDSTYVILGQSNTPDSSLFTEIIARENIPVFKRPSGGESVVLTKNMLVISLAFKEIILKNPKHYFYTINASIIDALTFLGVKDLHQRGISDICIGDKKILGSSIYRKPNRIFYHAVLNVSEETFVISKYLKHPSKEPDYRRHRNHADFVTSLKNEGYHVNTKEITEALRSFIVKLEKQLLFIDNNFSKK